MKKNSLKEIILPHQQCSKSFNTKFNSVEELFLSKYKLRKNKNLFFSLRKILSILMKNF